MEHLETSPPSLTKDNPRDPTTRAGKTGVLSFEPEYKFHVIYKTVNVLTEEYYIGLHSTNDLDDDYLGSGIRLVRSIRKYGKQNFIREIIELLPSRRALAAREAQLVTEETLQDPKCLNLAVGGDAPAVTKSVREKMSLAHKGKTPQNVSRFTAAGNAATRGRKHTDVERERMRDAWSRRNDQEIDAIRQKMSEGMQRAWARRKAA